MSEVARAQAAELEAERERRVHAEERAEAAETELGVLRRALATVHDETARLAARLRELVGVSRGMYTHQTYSYTYPG